MSASYPSIIASEQAFERYLAWFRPDLMTTPAALIAREDTTAPPAIRVYRALADRPEVRVVPANRFVALVRSADCIQSMSCRTPSPPAQP